MRSHNLYNVTTLKGGSLDTIVVDVRYDTPEERAHRAWCKLLEDKRSSHCKMAHRIIAELGVTLTKERFCKSLKFKKVN